MTEISIEIRPGRSWWLGREQRGLLGAEFIWKMVTCIHSLWENSSSCTVVTCALLYISVTLHIFSFFGHAAWPTLSLTPWPGVMMRSWQEKHQVLITRLPGNPLHFNFFQRIIRKKKKGRRNKSLWDYKPMLESSLLTYL